MKKVITYGTFDLFHEGHLRLLERAKALGDYLIVGVTSERFDRERGKLNVKEGLEKRIESVRASGYADEIIIEDYLGQKVLDIEQHGVDIFVLGSDWKGKFDYLLKYCDVVYLERTKGVSSSELREEGSKLLRLGIVADSLDDGGICAEAYYVSGLEVTGVYVPQGEPEGDDVSGEVFRAEHDLARAYESMEGLHEWSDVVYVHTRRRNRYRFACAAMRAGCHVICDFPLNNPEELKEIHSLAEEQGLVFIEYIPLRYLMSGATQMISSGKIEPIALSHDKARRLVALLEQGDLL